MANKRIRMGALKKAIFITFSTVVLLGAMSLPVYAYIGAADAAWTYMEGTGEKGTVESPESSVTVMRETQSLQSFIL